MPHNTMLQGIREGAVPISIQDICLMRKMFGQSSDAIALVEGPGHRLVYANDHFRALVATSAGAGTPLRDLLPSGQMHLLDEAYQRGVPISVQQYQFGRSAGAGAPQNMDVEFIPLAGGDGKENGVLIHAHNVVQHLGLEEEIKRQAGLLDALFNCAPCGIAIASAPDAKIVSVSAYATRLHGARRSDIEGHTVAELAHLYPFYRPQATEPCDVDDLPLCRAISRGELVSDEEWEVEDALFERVPIVCSAGPVKDHGGNIVGGVVTWYTTTRQKKLEAALKDAVTAKELLLRELSHRVKNNLQAAAMLLNIQGMQSRDPRVTEALREASGRIDALAAMHRGLYERPSFDGRLDFAAALIQLGTELSATTPNADRIDFDLLSPFLLDADIATPLLLLTHELVVNACKHAFPDNRVGAIKISLRALGNGRGRLSVSDEGVGLPIERQTSGQLGMNLIRGLARQAKATLDVRSSSGHGTIFELEFPISDPNSHAEGDLDAMPS